MRDRQTDREMVETEREREGGREGKVLTLLLITQGNLQNKP